LLLRIVWSATLAHTEMTANSSAQKELGAFYTPELVAEFLTNWAIRDAKDSVLDPSAGEGVFLAAARNRIAALGGTAAGQVRGIEVSAGTHTVLQMSFPQSDAGPTVIHADFFDTSADSIGKVTAVVGNPPFIRYHRFSGEKRRKALDRALQAGVKLSELSSSWAPFLVHATSFIRPGGRMAVVAPAELGYGPDPNRWTG
jgi:type I restriction-modification system DNA methylase subunit